MGATAEPRHPEITWFLRAQLFLYAPVTVDEAMRAIRHWISFYEPNPDVLLDPADLERPSLEQKLDALPKVLAAPAPPPTPPEASGAN